MCVSVPCKYVSRRYILLCALSFSKSVSESRPIGILLFSLPLFLALSLLTFDLDTSTLLVSFKTPSVSIVPCEPFPAITCLSF